MKEFSKAVLYKIKSIIKSQLYFYILGSECTEINMRNILIYKFIKMRKTGIKVTKMQNLSSTTTTPILKEFKNK